MYSIIQKIYEKNNKILKEGLKKVFSVEDVSSLTGAINEFTDILGKELFSGIAKQIDEIIFEDNKNKKQFEPVRFQEKSLITKNEKTKFERRYYKDKETEEYLYLTDAVLGIEKGERIDKNVKSEVIEKAKDQAYNKSGKMVVPELEISAKDKIKAKYIYIQVDEDHIKQRNKKVEKLEKRIRRKANKKVY